MGAERCLCVGERALLRLLRDFGYHEMRSRQFGRTFLITFVFLSVFAAFPLTGVAQALWRDHGAISTWNHLRTWLQSFGICLLLCAIVALLFEMVVRIVSGNGERPLEPTRECKSCGYSLRGNTIGRCLECGTTCELSSGGDGGV